ncbi:cyclic lactone autoinducer peptide [Paenibacillus sp. GCM10012307]|uniref:Cyclic lactone autoinducer peptide n=1 Tax=Paenibacillus roseus TaxID=2798579 RepID=A0A934J4P1_9BACL|nr:cyclic lactone autoinducer peptide [Paenibacillus roseus]MBJ6361609.1 cyclic lactone autoinducer peptide [Paenibacillus roseus]
MKQLIAKHVSTALNRIAAYFAATASPVAGHRPELPEELK